MSNNTKPQATAVYDLVSALAKRGRGFTDARNGVIAHLLTTGVAQADIVKGTGVDKGDVSRIAGYLRKGNKGKTSAQLTNSAKRLTVGSINPDDFGSITAAATLGSLLQRERVQASTKDKGTATQGTEDKGTATKGTTQPVADTLEAIREGVYAFSLTATDADFKRLEVALTEAMRQGRIDHKRSLSGKAPQGIATESAEVAA